jgi:hypothetical protein
MHSLAQIELAHTRQRDLQRALGIRVRSALRRRLTTGEA